MNVRIQLNGSYHMIWWLPVVFTGLRMCFIFNLAYFDYGLDRIEISNKIAYSIAMYPKFLKHYNKISNYKRQEKIE